MENSDNYKNKILVFIGSLILVGGSTLLFFLDKSLEWGFEKICSCVFVNLWLFFIIPALRNTYLLNRGKSMEEWFKMGFVLGAGGIFFPILLAPFFGVRYYLGQQKS